ncbi:uncharacterized protein EMH_0082690 [Eimeria mitis]|uniref:Uncharacterized protein n=1 Tax=Eimeria mitis TaxID=44415 RepID=U6K9H3_9EIME|nr:uncharacterized protein EMH_0082690 [Eimeria mitis]CDJ33456.1 hypothetical protein, conserved [Eimeria mitis]
MSSSLDDEVEEALGGLETVADELLSLLLFVCRKATAIASNSGFSSAADVNPRPPPGEAAAAAAAAAADAEAAAAATAAAAAAAADAAAAAAAEEKIIYLSIDAAKTLERQVLLTGPAAAAEETEEGDICAVSIPSAAARRQTAAKPKQTAAAATATAAAATAAAATAATRLAEPDLVFFRCPLTQEEFKHPLSQRYAAAAAAAAATAAAAAAVAAAAAAAAAVAAGVIAAGGVLCLLPVPMSSSKKLSFIFCLF